MRQMTIASLAAILAAGLIAAPAQGAASRSDARAYGKLCQNQSKKRVSGSTGTPFSRCVTALGRLARAQTRSPRIACATLTRKAGVYGEFVRKTGLSRDGRPCVELAVGAAVA